MNYDKTEILPIGKVQNNPSKILQEKHMKWTREPILTLGIKISNNPKEILEINYGPILTKIENIIKIWRQRDLTILGKTIVIKSFLISQFIYMLSVLPSPSDKLMKQATTMIYQFLWGNKPERIKRTVLMASKDQGGLQMMNLDIQNKQLLFFMSPYSTINIRLINLPNLL